MAEGNVIRQDIVQISFDVIGNPLAEVQKMINDIAGGTQGAVSSVNSITHEAQEAANSMQGIGDAAQQIASEAQNMTAPIQETADSMKGLDDQFELVKLSAKELDAYMDGALDDKDLVVNFTSNGIEVFRKVAKEATGATGEIGESAKQAEVRLSAMVKTLSGNITGKIKSLPTVIKSSATAAREFAASLKANVADGAIKGVNKLKNSFQAVKKIKLTDVVNGVDKGLGKAAMSAKQLASSLKSKAADKLKSSISGAAKESAKIKKEVDKGTKSIKDAAKEADGLKSKFSGIGGAVAKGIGGLAAGAAGGAAALVTGVVKSFGELEQNLGGAEAVFQNLGDSITEMTTTQQVLNASTGQLETQTTSLAALSENAYKTMGISQSDYLATANKMGALFQGSGLEQQRSLDLTTQAMQRAADMASVMGIDQASAMEAVTGAAKGNYEMMDNLGVAMNATTLQAYAVSKGINTAWDSMSNAEKAELSMQYFFERTSQYAGNFEREATQTVSGSFGLLRASAQSFVAGLGNADADVENLTNNMVEAFNAVVKNITPIIENLVSALPVASEALIASFGDLLPTLLSTFTELFEQVLKSILQLIPTVIPAFVDAVIEIAGVLVECVPMLADAAMQLVNGLLSGLGEALPDLIPTIIDALLSAVSAIIDQLPEFVDAAVQLVGGLAQGLLQAIPILIQQAPVLIENLMNALMQALPALLLGGFEIINMLVQGIITMLPTLLETGLNIILYLAQAIMSMLPQILMLGMQLLIQLALGILQALPQMITTVVQVVVTFIQTLTGMLPTIIQMGFELLGQLVFGLIQALPLVMGAANQVWMTLWNVISEVDWLQLGWDLLAALASGIWEGIKSLGSSIKDGIKSLFTGGGEQQDAQSAGAGAANAYSSGISAGSAGITTAASGIATTAADAMTFDASSLGLTMTTDFASGMTTGIDTATTSMQGMELDLTGIATQTSTGVTTEFTAMGTNMQTETKGGADGVMNTVNAMKNQLDSVDLYSTGQNMMDGLRNGMLNKRAQLLATARTIANEISDAMNSALQINSPSRVTEETGRFVDMGIIQGMKKLLPRVSGVSQEVGQTVATGVSYAESPAVSRYNSSNTTNNYNPQFTLNLNGASATDDNKKKVKQWIKESLKEIFEDMDRDNSPVWEV